MNQAGTRVSGRAGPDRGKRHRVLPPHILDAGDLHPGRWKEGAQVPISGNQDEKLRVSTGAQGVCITHHGWGFGLLPPPAGSEQLAPYSHTSGHRTKRTHAYGYNLSYKHRCT